MVFRKIISSALLLFSAYFSIFPEKFSEETAIFGNKLSQSVAATLEKNGYTAYVQQLTSTGQDDFAYNIIVEFDPSLKGNETEQSDSQDISRKEVIFCFTQEDFIAYQPGILDFLSSIKAMKTLAKEVKVNFFRNLAISKELGAVWRSLFKKDDSISVRTLTF